MKYFNSIPDLHSYYVYFETLVTDPVSSLVRVGATRETRVEATVGEVRREDRTGYGPPLRTTYTSTGPARRPPEVGARPLSWPPVCAPCPRTLCLSVRPRVPGPTVPYTPTFVGPLLRADDPPRPRSF